MIEELLLLFYEEKKREIDLENYQGAIDEIEKSPYFLLKDNKIVLNKKYYVGKIDVKKHFSFLLQAEEDLYIDNRDLNNALDDDIVLVKKEGNDFAVEKVLKRSLERIICTVKTKNKKKVFFSEKDYNRFITIIGDTNNLVNGHVVSVKIITIKKNEIVGEIEKVIGHTNDPDIDILKIVYGYDWSIEFNDDVLNEMKNIHVDYELELKARRDLRDELIITIDGADAKDLDDAISLKRIGNLYFLSVSIADVSHFVLPDSATDKEALNRATSVYLADRVIPMLPHYLSNNICSLNPNEEKLAVTCSMQIDLEGKVIDYEIFPSIITSKMRLTYDAVNDLLYNHNSLGSKEVEDMLFTMNELSLILRKDRTKKGAIEFKSDEIKFIFDEKKKVIDVDKRESKDAEKLIESFMLMANQSVAKFFDSLKYPSIYRIHEKPDLDRLEKAIETIKMLGVNVSSKVLNPKALQKITNDTINSRYEYIVHNTLLRAMKKAKYINHLEEHYGLQMKYYTHFTSPIRRYPDLMVHRLLKELVFEPTNLTKKINYYESILYSIASHSSNQERKAIDMEREVVKLKSCEYMASKIGNVYKGMIVKLINNGMFIRLDNLIEGFVNYRDLRNYYEYDENNQQITSKGGKAYHIGDTIKVEVLSVNVTERLINFKIYERSTKNENHRPKQKGKARVFRH